MLTPGDGVRKRGIAVGRGTVSRTALRERVRRTERSPEPALGNNMKQTDAMKKPGTGKPRLTLETVADLATAPPALKWDVDRVMVRGQPMVVGGPPKSLKTTLALDLAVSLATATPFLRHFPVPRKRRVAVFSGESGRATVYETVQRVLRSKRVSSDDCPLHLGFRLPRLAVPGDRTELRRLLAGEGIEAVVIDPVYLCLLAGGRTLSASNLFDVGAVLGAAADACARAGATLILVHHTVKGLAERPGPAGLGDLAFAGVGEFARQWLLVNRTAEYVPGTGAHELVLTVGGSAGHSSRWRVRVDEGATGAKGRKWEVAVEPRGAGGLGGGW